LLGTLAVAAAGRVFYQVALSVTDNDNGFVTMFFLLTPALSAVITLPLSWWISDLRFVIGPMFCIGLLLITAVAVVFAKDLERPRRIVGEPIRTGYRQTKGYSHIETLRRRHPYVVRDAFLPGSIQRGD
jgi:hypothetical protein